MNIPHEYQEIPQRVRLHRPSTGSILNVYLLLPRRYALDVVDEVVYQYFPDWEFVCMSRIPGDAE